MRAEMPIAAEIGPGQFFNIKVPGFYLRRPISVCDSDGKNVTFIYKTVGAGTAAMSRMKSGEKLDVLCPLGNGYDTSLSGKSPLVIGGGVGIPPLYYLVKELIRSKAASPEDITVILGFNTKSEMFLTDGFVKLGVRTEVTTVDGSYAKKGFVTDAMDGINPSFVYSCGPLAMMDAVRKKLSAATDGQFSLEERMGCGFGACMGCTVKTKEGKKRVCKEGPVFRKDEIIWEDLK